MADEELKNQLESQENEQGLDLDDDELDPISGGAQFDSDEIVPIEEDVMLIRKF